jgi:hypothetical protein
VLLNANPTTDIQNVGKILGRVCEGTIFSSKRPQSHANGRPESQLCADRPADSNHCGITKERRTLQFGVTALGVFTAVLTKHLKSFSLIDCIWIGVDRMERNFEAPLPNK